MTACTNCHCQPVRATVDLCTPCWRYQQRTGRPRPLELIIRTLDRTIERELAGRLAGP